MKYDNEIIGGMSEQSLKNYVENKDNYATIPFKLKKDPAKGWATPFVTGHAYRVHFGMTGINFENV